MANSYVIQQIVAANNGAAAGTTVSATLTATQFRSLLLAFVGIGVSGASITMPAGWKATGNIVGSNPSGGTFAVYVYQGNPGGITNVTATITSALASIIVVELISGYSDVIPTLVDIIGTFANTNGSGWGLGAQPNFSELNDAAFLVVGYMNPTALTATYPTGFTENANTIGTAASGNVGLRIASNLNVGKSNQSIGGLTISGTPANGPTTMYIALLFTPEISTDNNEGPQYYLVSN